MSCCGGGWSGSTVGGSSGWATGWGTQNGSRTDRGPCACSKVVVTKDCPRRPCCRKRNIPECPEITWPDPPKIDMCCSTSCPRRSIDICYIKVCPQPGSGCLRHYPCAPRTTLGQCCSGPKYWEMRP